jgi:adenine C2-methylase RlmN of 23S rRNA A2503 and tRNA A37
MRNLEPVDYDQVLAIDKESSVQSPLIKHCFMGMGEPLMNIMMKAI